VHLAYVGFVVLGQLAIVVGIICRWQLVRNVWFRLVHLAAIGYVGLESVFSMECPLTVWERSLRGLAGQEVSGKAFVARCGDALLMNGAFPLWAGGYLHITFPLVGLATFVLAPPRFRRHRLPTPG